jgi:hypothetical protein
VPGQCAIVAVASRRKEKWRKGNRPGRAQDGVLKLRPEEEPEEAEAAAVPGKRRRRRRRRFPEGPLDAEQAAQEGRRTGESQWRSGDVETVVARCGAVPQGGPLDGRRPPRREASLLSHKEGV